MRVRLLRAAVLGLVFTSGLTFLRADERIKTTLPLDSLESVGKDDATFSIAAFSADGRVLATVPGKLDEVHLWKTTSWTRTSVVKMPEGAGDIIAVAVIVSETAFVETVDANASVRFQDAATGAVVDSFLATARAPTGNDERRVRHAALSLNGQLLACDGEEAGVLYLWDVSARAQTRVVFAKASTVEQVITRSVAISPDGSVVAVSWISGYDDVFRGGGTELRHMPAGTLIGTGAGVLAMTTRGDRLVQGADGGPVSMKGIVAGGKVVTYLERERGSPKGRTTFHRAVVAVSGDARTVAAWSTDTVYVWD